MTARKIILAAVLLGAGIAGDVALQRIDTSAPATVESVDVAHDTAVLEFHRSFLDRVLDGAKEGHVSLMMGVLLALAELGVLKRRSAS